MSNQNEGKTFVNNLVDAMSFLVKGVVDQVFTFIDMINNQDGDESKEK